MNRQQQAHEPQRCTRQPSQVQHGGAGLRPTGRGAARQPIRGSLLAARLAAGVMLAATLAPAQAVGVVDPLVRPATVLRQPQRAALTGLAQAGQRLVAVGERGAVLLSDDAGAHWRQAQAVPVSVTLTAVQFATPLRGWALGHQGVVLTTRDGGETWQRQLDGKRIAQLLREAAQASGDAKAQAEAERLVGEGSDKPLLALHFRNEREGWVVGAFNLALSTQDGGKTWQSVSHRLPNPKGAHLYALHREGDTVLIAGEQGVLLHSSDGGERFERIPTPYGGSFFGVTQEASGAWLVAGLRGNVLRSVDGGKRWAALASPVPASVTTLMRDAQGQVWLMNQAGQLLRPEAGRLGVVSATSAQQPAALLRQGRGWLVAGWNGVTSVSPGVSSGAAAGASPGVR